MPCTISLGVALALGLLVAAPASARLVAVDGDSLLETSTGERIRLENVDAPEIYGHCYYERDLAWRAKVYVQKALTYGATVHRIGRLDRYGRTLALVEIHGFGDLGRMLMEAGLAREYHGRVPRQPWCR